MKEGTSECIVCESGVISWDDNNYAYCCSSCDFEVPFRLSRKQLISFLHGKNKLGSIIKRGEGDLEDKLRSLHNEIGATDEFKRRTEHLNYLVNKNKQIVLSRWNSRIGEDQKFPYYERGKWVIEIAEQHNLPIQVVSEILKREGKWNNASQAVWGYQLANRFGKYLKETWERRGGNNLIDLADHEKQLHLLERISETIGMSMYATASAMAFSGAWSGALWALSQQHLIEQYGLRVGDLWDNRQIRAKDNYTRWEVVESISKDLGGLVSPRGVLDILAINRPKEIKPFDSLLSYTSYKYANLCLKLIKKEGPKTAQAASEQLGVSRVMARIALNLLREQGRLKIHKEKKNIYYYFSGQEELLKNRTHYYGLEEKILKTGKNYVTVLDFAKIGDTDRTTANSQLTRLTAEGRFIIMNDAKPYLYIVRDENRSEKAMFVQALCHWYAPILQCFTPKGIRRFTITSRFRLPLQSVEKKLSVLEKYELVYHENNTYYLTHLAIKEMKKLGRKK